MSADELTKGELTREIIVQGAHELFVRQGFHGTSMRQIARRAGIALGGIYNHFSSKEDIFRAVFLENHPYAEMIPAIETAQGETLEAFVRDAATQMLSAINSRPDFLNLMFIEIVEFKSAHAHELFEILFPRGIQIVERMASIEGELRSMPAPMLMRAFMGFFISYHLADVVLGSVAPPEFSENAMKYYVDIFLHGILNE